ncbi:PREDICTED: cysteine proteinase inhibitor 6-like [Fragaria vesca subsp. vesca]
MNSIQRPKQAEHSPTQFNSLSKLQNPNSSISKSIKISHNPATSSFAFIHIHRFQSLSLSIQLPSSTLSLYFSPEKMAAVLGGVHESQGSQNSLETDELARFAVQEHNKKENALLEFVRVVKTKEQVVSGTVYYLTIEATDGGQKKLFEAKVWVKPWLNFKEVQEFKPVADV